VARVFTLYFTRACAHWGAIGGHRISQCIRCPKSYVGGGGGGGGGAPRGAGGRGRAGGGKRATPADSKDGAGNDSRAAAPAPVGIGSLSRRNFTRSGGSEGHCGQHGDGVPSCAYSAPSWNHRPAPPEPRRPPGTPSSTPPVTGPAGGWAMLINISPP